MLTKQIRPQTLQQFKEAKTPFTMLTAYDFPVAKLISEAEVPAILVGDSLGNVFAGLSDTLPVTVEHIIYHTQAVVRGAGKSLVVADMPFLSYQVSTEKAKENAGRLIKEGGAHCVKCEVSLAHLDTVRAIIQMGIPVMAHIGFTPQAIHQLGGYKVQGKTEESYQELVDTAKAMEEAGCFAILLEMVPNDLSKTISQTLTIPTIGIGAGPDCDGQVLVTNDVIGLTATAVPSFVKQYGQASSHIRDAVEAFKSDVETKHFPSPESGY